MEYGEDWEREALRDQWDRLERRRRATDRLLGGLALVLAGLVLSMVALAGDVCAITIGGATAACSAVGSMAVLLALGVLGVVAVGYGLYLGWTALGR